MGSMVVMVVIVVMVVVIVMVMRVMMTTLMVMVVMWIKVVQYWELRTGIGIPGNPTDHDGKVKGFLTSNLLKVETWTE